MSDFKAKMHQIRFRRGSVPNPAGEAYSAPPDPLVGLRGILLKGGMGGEGMGRGKRSGREWRKRKRGRKRKAEGKDGRQRTPQIFTWIDAYGFETQARPRTEESSSCIEPGEFLKDYTTASSYNRHLFCGLKQVTVETSNDAILLCSVRHLQCVSLLVRSNTNDGKEIN